MEENKLRILLVEDDLSTRKLERVIVERIKYEAVEAESGKQALELLEVEPIDIIIADVLMSEIDGLELLRKVRSDPKTARIPVILCTSVSDQNYVTEALELGIAGYILKPIVARELQRKLVKAEKQLDPVLEDPKSTMYRLGLEPSEFQDLLIMMADQAKGRIKDMGGKVEVGDLSDFDKFSRDLSASAGTFGAIALRNAASDAGDKIVTADQEIRQRYIFSLATQVERLRAAAGRML